MRITKLDLSCATDQGLKPGIMDHLEGLVVLAGPNGAGKSRILRTVNHALSVDLRKDALSEAKNLTAAVANKQIPKEALINLGQLQDRLKWSQYVQIEPEFLPGKVFEFVPKAPALTDHRQLREVEQQNAENSLRRSLGIGNIAGQALAYIANIYRRAFAASHQDLVADQAKKVTALDEKKSLEGLIEDLLGQRPDFDLDQQAILFGRPIPAANLSEGQSLLLQMAVALHSQGARLDGLVLLLDEPESHLHPSAIIQTLNRLRKANPTGQIWIATHSVPVLAALPLESIWYVNQGEASWAGRNPEIVLEGLLGGAEGRENVEAFLSLPAQFANHRFAAECLIAPKPASTGPDDPQARQVREFCELAAAGTRTPVRILDYGAGQGRLLSAIKERWQGEGQFHESIDYKAFEPFPALSPRLLPNVQAVFGPKGTERVFDTETGLSKIDDKSVDIVVMCNVLHEIPPEQWKKLFGANGTVPRLLKPHGRLLILEDMEIPHGELAHRFGFLLLDDAHLHKLMACAEADPEGILTISVRDDRLKVHAIPRSLLGRTTPESTKAALTLLRTTALERIRGIRNEEPSSRNGRLHALWTQMLANTDLGLEAMI
jgi:predicted ATPase/SAM-dependent methyltransferase